MPLPVMGALESCLNVYITRPAIAALEIKGRLYANGGFLNDTRSLMTGICFPACQTGKAFHLYVQNRTSNGGPNGKSPKPQGKDDGSLITKLTTTPGLHRLSPHPLQRHRVRICAPSQKPPPNRSYGGMSRSIHTQSILHLHAKGRDRFTLCIAVRLIVILQFMNLYSGLAKGLSPTLRK